MRARTVTDVILGEAVSGTPEERYRDMQAIASVMVNRANQLGVPLETVVSNTNEFNAYNRALPAGVNAYRSLAEQALTDVLTNGPVNDATFYATPAATKNLPKGLLAVDQTTGHQYFSDPYGRAIGTAVGYRQPNALSVAQIEQIDENNIPTPSAAPRGLLDTVQTASVTPVDRGILGDIAEPQSFDMGRFGDAAPQQQAQSFDMGRFGDTPAATAYSDPAQSFDAGRFGDVAQPAQTAFDSGRFGTATTANQGMTGLRDALAASNAQMAAQAQQGLLGTDVQAAQPAGPSMASLRDQYAQYGQAQQSMQDALAQQVANANLAADVADVAAQKASVKTGRLPQVTQPTVTQTQPGYVDPVVSAQPAQTVAAQPAAPARPMAAPSSAMAQSQSQSTQTALGKQVDRDIMARGLLGGIGGGLVGGALLGPVGAVLGGLLGRTVANRTYSPPAPENPTGEKKGSGYDSLSDYGREAYRDSKQVRDAVDSGKQGLW